MFTRLVVNFGCLPVGVGQVVYIGVYRAFSLKTAAKHWEWPCRHKTTMSGKMLTSSIELKRTAELVTTKDPDHTHLVIWSIVTAQIWTIAALILLMMVLTMKKGYISRNQVTFKPHEGSLIIFVELRAGRKTSMQLFLALSAPPPLPLFWGLQRLEPGNWPALPWLSLALLLSSFSLHHPAVARLTCKASSQKPVRGLDRLCRPGQRVHSYTTNISPCLSLVLTHTTNKWPHQRSS